MNDNMKLCFLKLNLVKNIYPHPIYVKIDYPQIMYNNSMLIRNNTTFFLSVVRTPKSGIRSNEDSFLFKKYHLIKLI